MSDWQVGDLAVCVRDGGGKYTIREGRVYTVTGLVDFHTADPGLLLAKTPSPDHTKSWAVRAFMKIHPDEHEACEPEFVTLLKRSKRKVGA